MAAASDSLDMAKGVSSQFVLLCGVPNDEGEKVRADISPPIIQLRKNWRAVVKCAKT
jgi:hypothetical protein